MKRSEVKIKRKMTAEAMVGILSDFVESFRQGTVCIQNGEEFVTLTPAGQIEMSMKAAEKKGKQKLEIEMSWEEVIPEEAEKRDFKITPEEPELKAPLPPEEDEPQTDDEESEGPSI
jgi:amphi-Trp domain-containing protein